MYHTESTQRKNIKRNEEEQKKQQQQKKKKREMKTMRKVLQKWTQTQCIFKFKEKRQIKILILDLLMCIRSGCKDSYIKKAFSVKTCSIPLEYFLFAAVHRLF